MRFFILLIDSQYENEWSWKHSLLFCVEFTFEVLKLVSYLGFFIILTKYYNMPIHLLRELYFAFSSVRRRFEVKHFKYIIFLFLFFCASINF